MKKVKNLEWGNYRHPEFLRSIPISVNELKFIRLFLKRGSVAIVNEMLRERKTKQVTPFTGDFSTRFGRREKIQT